MPTLKNLDALKSSPELEYASCREACGSGCAVQGDKFVSTSGHSISTPDMCCDNKIAKAQSIPLTENGLTGPRPNLLITIFVPSVAFFIYYLSYGSSIYYLTAQLLFILLFILISYITQLLLRTVLKPHLFFPAPQVLYFFVRQLR